MFDYGYICNKTKDGRLVFVSEESKNEYIVENSSKTVLASKGRCIVNIENDVVTMADDLPVSHSTEIAGIFVGCVATENEALFAINMGQCFLLEENDSTVKVFPVTKQPFMKGVYFLVNKDIVLNFEGCDSKVLVVDCEYKYDMHLEINRIKSAKII